MSKRKGGWSNRVAVESADRTVTKSIRLTAREADETARLVRVLTSASEAALIKEAYQRGLYEMKVEKAVARYLRRDLSIGEVAEIYGLSPADLTHELIYRKIKLMDDVPEDEVKESMTALLDRIGSNVQRAV